jgi:hypothetical protein
MWRHAAGDIFLISTRAFAFPLASYFVSSCDRIAELEARLGTSFPLRGFPGSIVYDFKFLSTVRQLHLKSREEWIGWSLRQRARRLNFVVNNSRLVILPARQSFSNLASRVLGLCLRAAQQRLEDILVYRGNQQPGRGAFRLGRRPVALRAGDLRARASGHRWQDAAIVFRRLRLTLAQVQRRRPIE